MKLIKEHILSLPPAKPVELQEEDAPAKDSRPRRIVKPNKRFYTNESTRKSCCRCPWPCSLLNGTEMSSATSGSLLGTLSELLCLHWDIDTNAVTWYQSLPITLFYGYRSYYHASSIRAMLLISLFYHVALSSCFQLLHIGVGINSLVVFVRNEIECNELFLSLGFIHGLWTVRDVGYKKRRM